MRGQSLDNTKTSRFTSQKKTPIAIRIMIQDTTYEIILLVSLVMKDHQNRKTLIH